MNYYPKTLRLPTIIIGIIIFIFFNCKRYYSGSTFASNQIFSSWEDVLTAPRSDYFKAEIADMAASSDYINKHPWLSEELLFIQSNTRILVCQNPKGEMRYAAMPTQVYPVPTARGIPSGPGYGTGMYYINAVKCQCIFKQRTIHRGQNLLPFR